MSDSSRCPAARAEDPTACDGAPIEVRVLDVDGTCTTGCVHHTSMLLSAHRGARAYTGSRLGAAWQAHQRAHAHSSA